MKNLIQDVVPPEEKKSIRDIPVPDRTLRSRFASKASENSNNKVEKSNKDNSEEEKVITKTRRTMREKPVSNKKGMRISIVSLAIIVIFFAGIFAATLFSSAVIKVVRHSVPVEFSSQSATVSYGPQSDIAQILSVEIPVGSRITATEEEFVSTKASGKIIIYNDYSTADQKLLATTRFESPSGKIYKIKDSVNVPGQKKVDGKLVPGSLEVTVYADKEGADYNDDLVDFTVPGFKGNPQYEKFYARSKTPMQGGFSGTVKKISESDLATAKNQLKNDINSAIESTISSRIPDGFIFYKEMALVTYDDLPQSSSDETSVQVNMKGVVKIPVFNKEKFAEKLADSYRDDTLTTDLPYIENVGDLNVNYALSNVNLLTSGDMVISVTGTSHAVWPIDSQLLRAKIAGTKRSLISSVLSEYRTIDRAEAFVKPFWKTSFPKDTSRIQIEFVNNI